MFPKKGKGMLLLADEGDSENETEGSGDISKTAVKTLFAAMKAGDVDAGAKALKAFMDACYAEE